MEQLLDGLSPDGTLIWPLIVLLTLFGMSAHIWQTMKRRGLQTARIMISIGTEVSNLLVLAPMLYLGLLLVANYLVLR